MAIKVDAGNWYDCPWRPIRKGIDQVTFALGAENVSCTIGTVENNAELRPHSHPMEQLALCLDGKCDYYVDGVPYKMTKGSWVVVPAGVEHYIHVYESDVPCLQMDIFPGGRPEYDDIYREYLKEQGREDLIR